MEDWQNVSICPDYVMTPDQEDVIKTWGETKRVVLIFFKWKYHCLTKMENFQKPKDAILIGFFAEQIRPTFIPEVLKHYDLILWYKADYTGYDSLSQDLFNEPRMTPELDRFLASIVRLVPLKKIELIEGEEMMITTLCHYREKYGLNGPRYDDLRHLRCKDLEKQLAEKEGIPTAKFHLLDFSKPLDAQKELEIIKFKINGFPMFRKPCVGAGCTDCVKINDEQELKQWLQDNIDNGDKGLYLIEEYISGPEFSACVCLLPDGSWKPLYISYHRERSLINTINTHQPMVFHGDRFEDCQDLFPNLEAFVDKVIKAFKPPYPHMLAIQGFQLEKNTDNYYLTEMTYRMQGMRDSLLSYAYSGVSQETALISCHIDPDYTAEPDPNWPQHFERHIWYPYHEGVLKHHQGVDASAPISSKIIYRWLVEPGTKLDKPKNMTHFIVHVILQNEDKKKLLADVDWMVENWKPILE